MNKNGLTLLELLIVITIIAILAGVALPYGKYYIDDSRATRAMQDLDEVRGALLRYETEQGKPYITGNIDRLVGPYMSKALVDPWGRPYIVDSQTSSCYSLGPDGKAGSGDEVKQYFRPPLAVSRAIWEDTNKNQSVDTGDSLIFRFTRPVGVESSADLLICGDDLVFSSGAPATYTSATLYDSGMAANFVMDFTGVTSFKAGLDTVAVKENNRIVDGDGTPCRHAQDTLIKAR